MVPSQTGMACCIQSGNRIEREREREKTGVREARRVKEISVTVAKRNASSADLGCCERVKRVVAFAAAKILCNWKEESRCREWIDCYRNCLSSHLLSCLKKTMSPFTSFSFVSADSDSARRVTSVCEN